MTGAERKRTLAYAEESIAAACISFGVVALPEATPLSNAARTLKKTVITGSEVFAIQAVEQFALYTGVRPSEELFRQAAAWSRQ